MPIKVIQQTTEERKQELIDTFNKMKPLLDEGWNFNPAYLHVTGKRSVGSSRRGAYKDIREYAKSQGYDPCNHEWRRRK